MCFVGNGNSRFQDDSVRLHATLSREVVRLEHEQVHCASLVSKRDILMLHR